MIVLYDVPAARRIAEGERPPSRTPRCPPRALARFSAIMARPRGIFARATPFRRGFKRDQRARANFHLARAFTLLFQLVEETLTDAVGLAKLPNTERQTRGWRRRDGSELG